MPKDLTIDDLRNAVAGYAAAFRCVTDYQPAGGLGDKVFPPTYEGGKYATEDRYIDGERVPCVLLDSVQSQANRMELTLLDAWEAERIPLPVVSVDFTGHDLPKPFRVTSLEAPHRVADALLRDGELDGIRFRKSSTGRRLDLADLRNATPLFELCPTALVFGIWDSTGEKGGLGAKFQRAMVSEIVGLHAVPGVHTSSRIDPAQILLNAGPIYRTREGGWTLDSDQAVTHKDKPAMVGKKGKPSEVNHGNVTPDISYRRDRNRNLIKDANGDPIPIGGFTISRAVQTTVLSLPALRRLRFPLGDERPRAEVELAARTALAALALLGATLTRAQGADLRSRCQLVATDPIVWELLDEPGQAPEQFSLTASQAEANYREAVAAAREQALPWLDEELRLQPSEPLLALVRRSQELSVALEFDESEGS